MSAVPYIVGGVGTVAGGIGIGLALSSGNDEKEEEFIARYSSDIELEYNECSKICNERNYELDPKTCECKCDRYSQKCKKPAEEVTHQLMVFMITDTEIQLNDIAIYNDIPNQGKIKYNDEIIHYTSKTNDILIGNMNRNEVGDDDVNKQTQKPSKIILQGISRAFDDTDMDDTLEKFKTVEITIEKREEICISCDPSREKLNKDNCTCECREGFVRCGPTCVKKPSPPKVLNMQTCTAKCPPCTDDNGEILDKKQDPDTCVCKECNKRTVCSDTEVWNEDYCRCECKEGTLPWEVQAGFEMGKKICIECEDDGKREPNAYGDCVCKPEFACGYGEIQNQDTCECECPAGERACYLNSKENYIEYNNAIDKTTSFRGCMQDREGDPLNQVFNDSCTGYNCDSDYVDINESNSLECELEKSCNDYTVAGATTDKVEDGYESGKIMYLSNPDYGVIDKNRSINTCTNCKNTTIPEEECESICQRTVCNDKTKGNYSDTCNLYGKRCGNKKCYAEFDEDTDKCKVTECSNMNMDTLYTDPNVWLNSKDLFNNNTHLESGYEPYENNKELIDNNRLKVPVVPFIGNDGKVLRCDYATSNPLNTAHERIWSRACSTMGRTWDTATKSCIENTNYEVLFIPQSDYINDNDQHVFGRTGRGDSEGPVQGDNTLKGIMIFPKDFTNLSILPGNSSDAGIEFRIKLTQHKGVRSNQIQDYERTLQGSSLPYKNIQYIYEYNNSNKKNTILFQKFNPIQHDFVNNYKDIDNQVLDLSGFNEDYRKWNHKEFRNMYYVTIKLNNTSSELNDNGFGGPLTGVAQPFVSDKSGEYDIQQFSMLIEAGYPSINTNNQINRFDFTVAHKSIKNCNDYNANTCKNIPINSVPLSNETGYITRANSSGVTFVPNCIVYKSSMIAGLEGSFGKKIISITNSGTESNPSYQYRWLNLDHNIRLLEIYNKLLNKLTSGSLDMISTSDTDDAIINTLSDKYNKGNNDAIISEEKFDEYKTKQVEIEKGESSDVLENVIYKDCPWLNLTNDASDNDMDFTDSQILIRFMKNWRQDKSLNGDVDDFNGISIIPCLPPICREDDMTNMICIVQWDNKYLQSLIESREIICKLFNNDIGKTLLENNGKVCEDDENCCKEKDCCESSPGITKNVKYKHDSRHKDRNGQNVREVLNVTGYNRTANTASNQVFLYIGLKRRTRKTVQSSFTTIYRTLYHRELYNFSSSSIYDDHSFVQLERQYIYQLFMVIYFSKDSVTKNAGLSSEHIRYNKYDDFDSVSWGEKKNYKNFEMNYENFQKYNSSIIGDIFETSEFKCPEYTQSICERIKPSEFDNDYKFIDKSWVQLSNAGNKCIIPNTTSNIDLESQDFYCMMNDDYKNANVCDSKNNQPDCNNTAYCEWDGDTCKLRDDIRLYYTSEAGEIKYPRSFQSCIPLNINRETIQDDEWDPLYCDLTNDGKRQNSGGKTTRDGCYGRPRTKQFKMENKLLLTDNDKDDVQRKNIGSNTSEQMGNQFKQRIWNLYLFGTKRLEGGKLKAFKQRLLNQLTYDGIDSHKEKLRDNTDTDKLAPFSEDDIKEIALNYYKHKLYNLKRQQSEVWENSTKIKICYNRDGIKKNTCGNEQCTADNCKSNGGQLIEKSWANEYPSVQQWCGGSSIVDKESGIFTDGTCKCHSKAKVGNTRPSINFSGDDCRKKETNYSLNDWRNLNENNEKWFSLELKQRCLRDGGLKNSNSNCCGIMTELAGGSSNSRLVILEGENATTINDNSTLKDTNNDKILIAKVTNSEPKNSGYSESDFSNSSSEEKEYYRENDTPRKFLKIRVEPGHEELSVGQKVKVDGNEYNIGNIVRIAEGDGEEMKKGTYIPYNWTYSKNSDISGNPQKCIKGEFDVSGNEIKKGGNYPLYQDVTFNDPDGNEITSYLIDYPTSFDAAENNCTGDNKYYSNGKCYHYDTYYEYSKQNGIKLDNSYPKSSITIDNTKKDQSLCLAHPLQMLKYNQTEEVWKPRQFRKTNLPQEYRYNPKCECGTTNPLYTGQPGAMIFNDSNMPDNGLPACTSCDRGENTMSDCLDKGGEPRLKGEGCKLNGAEGHLMWVGDEFVPGQCLINDKQICGWGSKNIDPENGNNYFYRADPETNPGANFECQCDESKNWDTDNNECNLCKFDYMVTENKSYCIPQNTNYVKLTSNTDCLSRDALDVDDNCSSFFCTTGFGFVHNDLNGSNIDKKLNAINNEKYEMLGEDNSNLQENIDLTFRAGVPSLIVNLSETNTMEMSKDGDSYILNFSNYEKVKKLHGFEIGNNDLTYKAQYTVSEGQSPLNSQIIIRNKYKTATGYAIHIDILSQDDSSLAKMLDNKDNETFTTGKLTFGDPIENNASNCFTYNVCRSKCQSNEDCGPGIQCDMGAGDDPNYGLCEIGYDVKECSSNIDCNVAGNDTEFLCTPQSSSCRYYKKDDDTNGGVTTYINWTERISDNKKLAVREAGEEGIILGDIINTYESGNYKFKDCVKKCIEEEECVGISIKDDNGTFIRTEDNTDESGKIIEEKVRKIDFNKQINSFNTHKQVSNLTMEHSSLICGGRGTPDDNNGECKCASGFKNGDNGICEISTREQWNFKKTYSNDRPSTVTNHGNEKPLPQIPGMNEDGVCDNNTNYCMKPVIDGSGILTKYTIEQKDQSGCLSGNNTWQVEYCIKKNGDILESQPGLCTKDDGNIKIEKGNGICIGADGTVKGISQSVSGLTLPNSSTVGMTRYECEKENNVFENCTTLNQQITDQLESSNKRVCCKYGTYNMYNQDFCNIPAGIVPGRRDGEIKRGEVYCEYNDQCIVTDNGDTITNNTLQNNKSRCIDNICKLDPGTACNSKLLNSTDSIDKVCQNSTCGCDTNNPYCGLNNSQGQCSKCPPGTGGDNCDMCPVGPDGRICSGEGECKADQSKPYCECNSDKVGDRCHLGIPEANKYTLSGKLISGSEGGPCNKLLDDNNQPMSTLQLRDEIENMGFIGPQRADLTDEQRKKIDAYNSSQFTDAETTADGPVCVCAEEKTIGVACNKCKKLDWHYEKEKWNSGQNNEDGTPITVKYCSQYNDDEEKCNDEPYCDWDHRSGVEDKCYLAKCGKYDYKPGKDVNTVEESEMLCNAAELCLWNSSTNKCQEKTCGQLIESVYDTDCEAITEGICVKKYGGRGNPRKVVDMEQSACVSSDGHVWIPHEDACTLKQEGQMSRTDQECNIYKDEDACHNMDPKISGTLSGACIWENGTCNAVKHTRNSCKFKNNRCMTKTVEEKGLTEEEVEISKNVCETGDPTGKHRIIDEICSFTGGRCLNSLGTDVQLKVGPELKKVTTKELCLKKNEVIDGGKCFNAPGGVRGTLSDSPLSKCGIHNNSWIPYKCEDNKLSIEKNCESGQCRCDNGRPDPNRVCGSIDKEERPWGWNKCRDPTSDSVHDRTGGKCSNTPEWNELGSIDGKVISPRYEMKEIDNTPRQDRPSIRPSNFFDDGVTTPNITEFISDNGIEPHWTNHMDKHTPVDQLLYHLNSETVGAALAGNKNNPDNTYVMRTPYGYYGKSSDIANNYIFNTYSKNMNIGGKIEDALNCSHAGFQDGFRAAAACNSEIAETRNAMNNNDDARKWCDTDYIVDKDKYECKIRDERNPSFDRPDHESRVLSVNNMIRNLSVDKVIIGRHNTGNECTGKSQQQCTGVCKWENGTCNFKTEPMSSSDTDLNGICVTHKQHANKHDVFIHPIKPSSAHQEDEGTTNEVKLGYDGKPVCCKDNNCYRGCPFVDGKMCNNHGVCAMSKTNQDDMCICEDGYYGDGCQFSPENVITDKWALNKHGGDDDWDPEEYNNAARADKYKGHYCIALDTIDGKTIDERLGVDQKRMISSYKNIKHELETNGDWNDEAWHGVINFGGVDGADALGGGGSDSNNWIPRYLRSDSDGDKDEDDVRPGAVFERVPVWKSSATNNIPTVDPVKRTGVTDERQVEEGRTYEFPDYYVEFVSPFITHRDKTNSGPSTNVGGTRIDLPPSKQRCTRSGQCIKDNDIDGSEFCYDEPKVNRSVYKPTYDDEGEVKYKFVKFPYNKDSKDDKDTDFPEGSVGRYERQGDITGACRGAFNPDERAYRLLSETDDDGKITNLYDQDSCNDATAPIEGSITYDKCVKVEKGGWEGSCDEGYHVLRKDFSPQGEGKETKTWHVCTENICDCPNTDETTQATTGMPKSTINSNGDLLDVEEWENTRDNIQQRLYYSNTNGIYKSQGCKFHGLTRCHSCLDAGGDNITLKNWQNAKKDGDDNLNNSNAILSFRNSDGQLLPLDPGLKFRRDGTNIKFVDGQTITQSKESNGLGPDSYGTDRIVECGNDGSFESETSSQDKVNDNDGDMELGRWKTCKPGKSPDYRYWSYRKSAAGDITKTDRDEWGMAIPVEGDGWVEPDGVTIIENKKLSGHEQSGFGVNKKSAKDVRDRIPVKGNTTDEFTPTSYFCTHPQRSYWSRARYPFQNDNLHTFFLTDGCSDKNNKTKCDNAPANCEWINGTCVLKIDEEKWKDNVPSCSVTWGATDLSDKGEILMEGEKDCTS